MNGLLPLILLLLPATINADNLGFDIGIACPDDMNYTRGGAFQASDVIRCSLRAAAAASSGFAENVTGAAPDQAYGLAQCGGDASASECRSRLDGAVRDMASECPGQKKAALVYEGWSYLSGPLQHPARRGGHVPGAGAGTGRRATHQRQRPLPHPAKHKSSQRLGPLRCGEQPHGQEHTALLVSVPVAIALLLLVAVYICKNRKAHKHVLIARDGYGDDEEMRCSGPLQYDLSTLRAATENFSEENKIGQGGFGPVYKGTLENGEEIAVKRLAKISQQGHAEMKNEVFLVAKLQHRNLVCLLGFCIEEEEKLLVYEFLSNKSLDKFIFGPATQQELSWGQRKKFIEGIGRGLMYLHEDSRLKIIHRDLKAGNILLDADMNPKISDFGLAKSFSIDASKANTDHVAGTYGYMAPEYVQQGTFSAKSDVFSYGVLVLEIITGKRVHEDLVESVWRHWSLGSVLQLLDGYPADEPGRQDMLRCIHIGLLCIQEDPQLRPSMASVLQMLKHRVVTMSAPTKPAFVIPGPGERPRVAAPEPSSNDASVSDLEPR